MDYVKKSQQIANSFYNLGLEKAKIRDLTGAATCLKKSVHFNKYHTTARNLLGLIYYEIGERSEALVQWVISMNLQPADNLAAHYLEEMQGKPGSLENDGLNVKKYNQALIHAQGGSDDLAVLQLTRVVEVNPHFVKAQLLLALLYISHEDYTKAGKSLYKVLKIDKNNPKALWYMSIVKANTGKAEIERRKLKNAFSHRQMQDDDIIIPPTYKENTGWQTVINLIVGLLLGITAFYFLIMPAHIKAQNHIHNQEILHYSEEVNQGNLKIDEMKQTMEKLQQDQNEAQNTLQSVEDSSREELAQYQRLIGILQANKNADPQTAVLLYADLNPSVIRDEATKAVIAQIKTEMEANGYPLLADLGDKAREAGKPDDALLYYQKSLNIKADNPQVIFNMALIYKAKEDKDRSNELFGQVIMNYPDHELAVKAKEERGY
ncbi:MAG: tetratricopeptide repeat protein [Hungatella sp.]